MTEQKKRSKALHIGLWIVQVLLGLMFLAIGMMKTFQPVDEMAKALPWVKDYVALVRFIGISELLGGLGLILPSLLRIRPALTPLAALGIAIIMVLAIAFHTSRGEFSSLGMNILLLLLALFVAWGRYKKAPVQVKNKVLNQSV